MYVGRMIDPPEGSNEPTNESHGAGKPLRRTTSFERSTRAPLQKDRVADGAAGVAAVPVSIPKRTLKLQKAEAGAGAGMGSGGTATSSAVGTGTGIGATLVSASYGSEKTEAGKPPLGAGGDGGGSIKIARSPMIGDGVAGQKPAQQQGHTGAGEAGGSSPVKARTAGLVRKFSFGRDKKSRSKDAAAPPLVSIADAPPLVKVDGQPGGNAARIKDGGGDEEEFDLDAYIANLELTHKNAREKYRQDFEPTARDEA